MTNIVVYSKSKCVQCEAVKKHLQREGIDFEVRNAEDHIDELRAMGFSQVPIVKAEGVEPFYGYNISKIQQIIAGR